jgi:hypothetical protein
MLPKFFAPCRESIHSPADPRGIPAAQLMDLQSIKQVLCQSRGNYRKNPKNVYKT